MVNMPKSPILNEFKERKLLTCTDTDTDVVWGARKHPFLLHKGIVR